MYKNLKFFEENKMIKILSHRQGEYLIEINPFYGWRAESEYGRYRTLRRFYK